jgi:hypothetical protein
MKSDGSMPGRSMERTELSQRWRDSRLSVWAAYQRLKSAFAFSASVNDCANKSQLIKRTTTLEAMQKRAQQLQKESKLKLSDRVSRTYESVRSE